METVTPFRCKSLHCKLRSTWLYIVLACLLAGCQSYQEENSRTPGEFTDDVYIQAAVKTSLVRDKNIGGLEINVEVRRGVVTVYGPVETQSDRDQIRTLSLAVRGVKEFVDRLTLVTAAQE